MRGVVLLFHMYGDRKDGERNGKEEMKCEKIHCMCNVDGKCGHRKCPLTDPEHKMPGIVASEKEAMTKELYEEEKRLEKEDYELKKTKTKTKKKKDDNDN